MPIPGTVPFTGLVAPTDTTDTYAVTDPIYGKDGLRSVVDHTERDAISADRRREGMLVYTQNDGKYWKLGSDLTTWTEFTSGGGGTPGGSDTQVQFNDGGSFGGDSGFTYDKNLQAISQGTNCLASGLNSHAQGETTTASGDYSHAQGTHTVASGDFSHAEGNNTTASGENSHAEGDTTTASGEASHAEGASTASGDQSHAEGSGCTASGTRSHAEGQFTLASALSSHAEGSGATASGVNSHAEGNETVASGVDSHAGGAFSAASLKYQFARSDGGFGGLAGDGQHSTVSLSIVATDTSATTLFIGGGRSGTDLLIVRPGFAYGFVAHVMGASFAGTAYFIRQGMITNVAGTTSFVGPVTTIGTDNNSPGWTVAITANDTTDSLDIVTTSVASVHWYAKVELIEIEL